MTVHRFRLFVFILALFGVFGCSTFMKIDEATTGSQDWVQELTKDIDISTEYPEGNLQQNAPYNFVFRLENHGKREPHLNYIYVEIDGDVSATDCQMQEPKAIEVEKSDWSYYFTLPHVQVQKDKVTEIRLQCVFRQPGMYEVIISPVFTESAYAFAEIVTTLDVR